MGKKEERIKKKDTAKPPHITEAPSSAPLQTSVFQKGFSFFFLSKWVGMGQDQLFSERSGTIREREREKQLAEQ